MRLTVFSQQATARVANAPPLMPEAADSVFGRFFAGTAGAAGALATVLLMAALPVMADADEPVTASETQSDTQYQPNRQVEAFLDDIRAARARQQAYSGTFVLSDGRAVTSTRTRYACDGRQFVESMESLGGRPQVTAYDDQRMYSMLPDERRMVIAPYFRSVIPLHALHKTNLKELSRYYRIGGQQQGQTGQTERVAGLPARVVVLAPQDDLRYGYRIWLNPENQWVLKMETVQGIQVLESMVFTHIHVEEDAGKALHDLRENTRPPAGFAVEGARAASGTVPVPPAYDDWEVGAGLPGFQVVQQQAVPATADATVMAGHWLLSDGLAVVSVFAEPFRGGAHRSADDGRVMRLGASTMYSRRRGGQWVIATGEVPVKTLRLLVDGLELLK